ncbi:hypothetical protein ACB098_06G026600 [Castanea mollissima]
MANLCLCFFLKFTVIHIYMNMNIIKSNISNENPPMHHFQDNVFLRSAPNLKSEIVKLNPKAHKYIHFTATLLHRMAL